MNSARVIKSSVVMAPDAQAATSYTHRVLWEAERGADVRVRLPDTRDKQGKDTKGFRRRVVFWHSTADVTPFGHAAAVSPAAGAICTAP